MKTVTIECSLDECDDEPLIRQKIAKKSKFKSEKPFSYRILKKSLDARRGRVRFHYLVQINPPDETKESLPKGLPQPDPKNGHVIVVGAGPAGLFCAYELARHKIRSTIVERGKDVQARRKDLKGLNQHGRVDSDSNYCFGEGGAGTYSDGKLYTRAHKRGDIRDVIEILNTHGAPEKILTDARPHIGSNKLPKVIQALRQTLEAVQCEFKFGQRMSDFILKEKEIIGIQTQNGDELLGDAVVLATGHSAKDVYEIAHKNGLELNAKTFALGVRIEHPQPLINDIQYGDASGHPKLPPAAYRVAHHEGEHGAYSFCMCPGGWIVPATTTPKQIVVNGMSLSKRDSPFANSGFVVSMHPQDLEKMGYKGVWAGVQLQQDIEKTAFAQGEVDLKAPAVRVTDFLENKTSSTLPKTSYIPGIVSSNLSDTFRPTGNHVVPMLKRALLQFDKKLKGYITEDAILVGVETRTSSPLRMERDPNSLESTRIQKCYPCGEGAGYAGGIMSAAMDGTRVARAIHKKTC